MSDVLRRFAEALHPLDRARMIEDPFWQPSYAVPVERHDGGEVPLEAVDDLMRDLDERTTRGQWSDDRAASDRWLAPRLHWALRLDRSLAAERSLWLWLTVRHRAYVDWRWGSPAMEQRWSGGVNKQALARLWWGAELFRNGSDYGPAGRAFIRQDLTNSYLHRPIVRHRPLALALVNTAAPNDGESMSADDINDLARAVNIATVGSPPEAEIGASAGEVEDLDAYLDWATQAPVADGWDRLPVGPPVRPVAPEVASRADAVAARYRGFSEYAARVRNARSHRRRSHPTGGDAQP